MAPMLTETATPPSAITTRQLPPDEWQAKLTHLPPAILEILDPALTVILVAENALGAVVGVWMVMTTVHLDGLWVRADHQHTLVASKLLRGMRQILTDLQIPIAFTIVQDIDVLCLAHKAGFQRVPGDLLMLQVAPQEG